MSTIIDLSPVRQSTRGGARPVPVLRATWHEDPLITLDGAVPCLVAPSARDPLRGPDGSHVIPDPQLAELRRLVSQGLRFDEIAIAHELDPRGPVSGLLPVLRRGPVTCSDEVARAVVGPVPDHPVAARGVQTLDRITSGFRAAGSLVRTGAQAVLDPIVFGVIGLDSALYDGAPAQWYPLVAWTW